jgi:acetylornithine deacetylase/succinyl-diaminopimelate desuccinylase-like protein
LNIGKIMGGIQWSIVPEFCKVEMDRRLLPGETREKAVAELQDALEAYKQSVEPLDFELFSTGEVAGNIDTPPEELMVSMAQTALADLIAIDRPLTGYAQTSDGRWFARDGIPIILFGPGDPALAHSTDEFIEIEQLIEATRFLTLMALRYLS